MRNQITANGNTYDRGMIRKTIQLLISPESVVELRALNVQGGGTVSGYFDGDHRTVLVDAAVELSGRAQGIYFTPNPVNHDLLARATNRVKKFAKDTTKDAEV